MLFFSNEFGLMLSTLQTVASLAVPWVSRLALFDVAHVFRANDCSLDIAEAVGIPHARRGRAAAPSR